MTAAKICGLTNLADARHAAACGADLLGLIFVPTSPRAVSPEAAAEIVATLRAEGGAARFVGVFTRDDAEGINTILEDCALDLAQLHSPRVAVGEIIRPCILARRATGDVDGSLAVAPNVWALLLDTPHATLAGGTGLTWDWRLAAGPRSEEVRLILAGGLTPDNVAEAIRVVRPWGVDVASGVEASPGIKDPARVARFLQAVREAEAAP
jgi:phosphoribosylanthranilate isomerase